MSDQARNAAPSLLRRCGVICTISEAFCPFRYAPILKRSAALRIHVRCTMLRAAYIFDAHCCVLHRFYGEPLRYEPLGANFIRSSLIWGPLATFCIVVGAHENVLHRLG